MEPDKVSLSATGWPFDKYFDEQETTTSDEENTN